MTPHTRSARSALLGLLAALVLLAVVALLALSPVLAQGAPPAQPSARQSGRFELVPVDREPAERSALDEAGLAKLREAVARAPRERQARFELVKALVDSGRLREALVAAEEWRGRDAYNLVVVRLLGDILVELGEREAARRTYSAVVELLAKEPGAHRALATVLRQSGDLQAAYAELRAAAELRAEDQRIAFELADTAQRIGRDEEAAQRFVAIISDAATPEAIRYPAKQRLAQLYAAARREALRRQDHAAAARQEQAISALNVAGGVVNDLKVYLTWDTDQSDVDLWVVNPEGEKIFYQHRRGKHGEALFDDVTSGYGPESFTAQRALPGTYLIQVNFYGTSRRTLTEARGEVAVVLNEGREEEQRHTLPYRLFKPAQTVTVARVIVH